MFLSTFHQVKRRVDRVGELILEYKQKVTQQNFRQEAPPIVVEILREFHFLTVDRDELMTYRVHKPFQQWTGEVQQIVRAMYNNGLADEAVCPECKGKCSACGEPMEERPVGPIDRPLLPPPPLAITGPLVAAFMRDIRDWLAEAMSELLEEAAPELPSAPGRYIIGDNDQLLTLAQLFQQLTELSSVWSSIIQVEGPEWTSTRVGLRRLDLVNRVHAAYLTMANPEPTHSRGFASLFGM